MDIALDANGDLLFTDDGDLALVTGVDAIAQHLAIRLRTFQGEWFLDETVGVPWFQSILGQRASATQMDSILRAQILKTPGILSVVSLTFSAGETPRSVQMALQATCSDGSTLTYSQTLGV